MSNDASVIVVGAGPTGLVLANILGMHGVRTLLVEANPSTVGEPRAVSIDDESLRTMQYLGIVDAVRSRINEGYGSYYFAPSGRCFAKVLPAAEEYGFARRSAFRQPILEAQLRESLARFASVSAHFSTTVRAVSQEPERVAVTLESSAGTRRLSADYVVACDGARSSIRESLGIALSGSTYEQRWLIVDLVGSVDRFRHTKVYCDPARPALALPGPEGTRRYEFMALPGEDADALLAESRIRSLLARHSEIDARLPIARKVVYQFHARIADRWRVGRIFLAGDAAHLSPPFAGQGMNSGVRDAQNLGWKLALVSRGGLGAGVLASYETERKSHAWALIQMAVRMGRVMMPRSAVDAFGVQTALRALSLYPPARDYVMQMKYKPKPHFAAGFVAGADGPGLRGRMFPQPVVQRPDGTRVLLDEVLGKGFAAVEMHDGESASSGPLGSLPLDAHRVRVVPKDHRFVDLPEGVETVRDVGGTIEQTLAPHGLRGVIVRPDRYVAACLSVRSDASAARLALEALADAAGTEVSATISPSP